MRNAHLGCACGPGGSCAPMKLGSCIFKIGYKKILMTLGNRVIVAKMGSIVMRIVWVVIFSNWYFIL